jgi:1,4-alpha-glucan branching enzyme
MMSNGYFSLVLHAHIPYVRHNEAHRLEERWLYEALTETYIPLIWMIEEQPDSTPWTLSFSPPLLEMLNDSVIQKRYLEHLDLTLKLIQKEKSRPHTEQESEIIKFYEKRYQKLMFTYQRYECQITHAFQSFMHEGKIACCTSAATHAFLPYIQTEQGVKAQIDSGIRIFEKYFGEKPKGFWLPECAYTAGVDKLLAEAGIRYTFVDEHTLLTSKPSAAKGIGAPVYSPHGIALFPRNQSVTETIWNSSTGYPGDYYYREFYRDIAYERDQEYIKGFIHPDGIRIDSGLKYWRITGRTEQKEWYNRQLAEEKTGLHAEDFTRRISLHLHHNVQAFPPHIITAPFDAELFGHWWYEGPEFLQEIMKISAQKDIEWITPEEFLHRHYQDLETVRPALSTWGRNGYGEVWLNESNGWMYRHLHRCEKKLVQLAALLTNNRDPIAERYGNQMVREWMLAASSDWAFIIDGNSAVQYAKNRFQLHIERFNTLYQSVMNGTFDKKEITYYEKEFPFLDMELWTYFISRHDQYVKETYSNREKRTGKKILMLSWEYPPMVVGGLSRHVYDLSRKLASMGNEVYVLTSFVEGYPDYEKINGVHVYRIKGRQPSFESFFHWTGSLNLSIAEQAIALSKKMKFDCIHAHDWLVSVAAIGIKNELNIPLITTVHATEHGRNNGISTPLQYEIHQKEKEIMDASDGIIVCSRYMKKELVDVFQIPDDKISILQNGIHPEEVNTGPLISDINESTENQYEAVLFSVGRLVKEKGFQTIIKAAESLRNKGRRVRFVIAGKGPMFEELQRLINEKHLDDYVHLTGFISDEERNKWFLKADAAIFPSHYEPFGIVALEGMASGKLTIVSDTGGLSEIIDHEHTGLKIFPNDADSIVWAVEYLLAHPLRCKEIAKNGEMAARTMFSWDSISERTIHLYDKVQFEKNKLGGVVL